MIAVEKTDRAGLMLGTMGKAGVIGLDAKGSQHAVMGDATKKNTGLDVRQRCQFVGQERPAGIDLRAGWFVRRRDATNGVDDAGVYEFEAIIRPLVINACCETKIQHGRVEKIARPIARERPSGAVRSLKSGRQPNDEQTGCFWPEGGHRRIVPIRMLLPPFFTKGDKTRA